jgi:hypothetical protein
MVATVGGINIALQADTTALVAGFTKGERRVQSFATAATLAAAKVEGRFAMMSAAAIRFQRTVTIATQAAARGLNLPALIGGFGVAAFGSKIRDAIGEIGDLADAAARAGVSAEKLQVIRQALAQNGGEADKADIALRGLSVRLGDLANTGAGSAAPAMKALGLTFAQLAGLSADQRFDVIAAKLAAVADPARRAGLAAKFFGDEAGPQLAALLAQGNSVLAETETRMRAYGQLVGNNTVKEGHDLNVAMLEWSQTFDTVFKKAVVGSANAIYDLIDSFRALRNQTSLRNLSAELDAIAAKRDALNSEIASIQADNPPGAAIGPGRMLIDSQIGDLKRQLLDLDKQASAVLNRIGQLNTETKVARPALGAGGDGGTGVINLKGQADADAAAAKIQQVRDALKFQADQLGRTAREQFVYNQLQQAGTTANTAQGAAIASAAGRLFDQQSALAKLNERMATFRDTAHDALSTFIGDLRQGKSGAEALTDALGNVADKLTELALNKALQGLFGGGATGGGGGFLSQLLSFFGGGGVQFLTPSSFLHSGGVVGRDGVQKPVSAAAFIGAPRHHMGKLGLRAGEIPSILKTGETVLTEATSGRVASTMGGLAAAVANGGGKGGGNVYVTVEKGAGTDVKTKTRTDSNGDIRVAISTMMAEDFARGGLASQMIEGVYGLNRANGMRGR